MARIPPDAFSYYTGLGCKRSYEAVARHYHVSKRAVTKRAAKEHWSARLARIESEARERADDQAADSIQVVNTRHLKMLRAIQAKALQGLQSLPLATGMDAVRALDLAVKAERTILGQKEGAEGVRLEDLVANAGRVVKDRLELLRERVQIQVVTGVPPSDYDPARERSGVLAKAAQVRSLSEPGRPTDGD